MSCSGIPISGRWSGLLSCEGNGRSISRLSAGLEGNPVSAGRRCSNGIFSKRTVELQWLEQWWLTYHGYFELILESLGKNSSHADLG